MVDFCDCFFFFFFNYGVCILYGGKLFIVKVSVCMIGDVEKGERVII